MAKQSPPKDGLIRAVGPGIGLERAKAEEGGMPTLRGHFAVFNTWTEVNSIFEGHFRERIAPGAFAKTFKENRDNIKVLFQHGADPQVGDKPLGRLTELREDETGAYYEAPLFDTSYNRDLIPGLEAGVYGASFKFRVLQEEFVEEPEPSDENPKGLPERTIKEAQVFEGGPVTFGQYPEATASARSLTDRIWVQRAKADPSRVPELVELFTDWVRADPERVRGILVPDTGDINTSTEPGEAHSDDTDAGAAEEHSERDAENNGAGTDHSVATEEERSEHWFADLTNDDEESEFHLP